MRVSLTARISIAIIGVLVLAVLSAVVAIVSAHRFEAFQATLIDENLASVRAAQELEIALLAQRGFVSSYILDKGNVAWLKELNQWRQSFEHWLTEARSTARSDRERQILDQLEIVQDAYSQKRDFVVTLYDSGKTEEAKNVLLHDVAERYEQSYHFCEQFIEANQQLVASTSTHVRHQVEIVSSVAAATLVITLLLGLALLWLFIQGVIIPLRRIASVARQGAGGVSRNGIGTRRDELGELGDQVRLLMTNFAETRSDLEQSRTQLAHAEKLAAVGKLAASLAHEIRNPLTSMKMWLYSLRQNLSPSDESRQKLEIVSEEITRLEKIVRNFLEFSRPPRLNLCRENVRALIDETLVLQKHVLDERQILLVRLDEPNPSETMVDREHLKQVFVNLINNAVDVMPHGGHLRISLLHKSRGGREMVVVTFADTGPGMPADVQNRIFEPFFTTKQDGLGLGLCISASIMTQHNGALILDSSHPTGTTWAVWIPAAPDA